MAVMPQEQNGSSGGLPPHNDEAEVGVLGTVLMTESALDSILVEMRLRAEDFYRPRHQLIFTTMLRLKEKAEPEAIDAITVCDELKREAKLEEAGGQEYIHSLPTMVLAMDSVRDYARIVSEHAMLRRLLGAAHEITQKVVTDATDPRSLVEQAEQAIFEAGHHADSSQIRSIHDVLEEELDKLERLSKEGTSLTGTPSGFKDLDEITGGFQPGNLIVLAARPAMGKCLPGSALVYDPTTGTSRRMDAVIDSIEAGDEVWVASLAPDLTLRPSRAVRAFRNGRRAIFRVTTRLGRSVDATANHPLLTLEGWKRVDELCPGARVGVPHRLPRRAAAGTIRPPGEKVAQGNATATVQVGERTHLAEADIWWDHIVSIEPVGVEDTFDIEVPVDHSFVANDIVVHNSALAANVAENAAVDFGKTVALFSLEMSEGELAQRFIASRGKINGESLRKGRVRTDQWPKLLKATEKLSAAPLFVDDSSDIGVAELRAKARRLSQKEPLDLIVIDYLQLMRAEDPRDGRVEQVGKMSRGLKILARELEVPVIAISQLSRAVESRPDKRPLMSDLRESGNIEQDADLVMFVYRDEYYNKEASEKPGIAEVIIGKHRNGPVGSVELTFLDRYPKFMNKAPDRYAAEDPTAGGS